MIENVSFNTEAVNGLSDLLGEFGKTTSVAFSQVEDLELQKTLDIIQNLGDRIAVFFLRIKKLIQIKSDEKNIQFVTEYFFKNFSQISENTKASKHIISYSIKRLDWLKEHMDRIVDSLKLLYSDLLAMQIDCEEFYRNMFHKELAFDFGLNFHREMETLKTIVSVETAYQLLDITEDSTRDEVKTAFRNLAKKMHPDLNPGADEASFIQLEMAYKKILSRMN